MNVIDLLDQEQRKPSVPDFRSGDTVKVYSKVVEGGKERIQMFLGVVIDSFAPRGARRGR